MAILYMSIGILLLLMCYSFYKRYVPVQGIKKVTTVDCASTTISYVDVRHFHEMKQNPCQKAIHIPLPYLERQHEEIPYKEVVVIVPDSISRNLSIRQLKKHGYQVKGYMFAERCV
ncbi:rhodanese-like domain-containing protein [Priestia megaterium]|uniref:rhodanese-like domain-containing protein n=1 Tax=Priestia megaterium TaxID=1404 RepID=UPI0021AD1888|nr:rhodanese-like domain-containing protein [Priestia megaterium]MCR8925819.1 rhodanese-like domain-containing protein [Priestia megaterium]